MDERMYYRQGFPMYHYEPPFMHQQPPYPTSYPVNSNPPQPTTPYELFAKPVQPLNWMDPSVGNNSMNQGGSQQGVNGPFTGNDGQLDFDKMLSTIGQLASTYHQVSPIVKQFSSLMKLVRE